MTPDLIAACTGSTLERAQEFASPLTAAMSEFFIITAPRQAAFLAQIGHESGGLNWLSEIWGPNAQQRRYERDIGKPWPSSPEMAELPAYEANRLAYTLGNINPGDGSLFRGHGLLQITGRTNHRITGQALGVDLEADPDRLTEPGLAARSAAHFFNSKRLNEFADGGNFAEITKRINGGMTGLSSRMALWVTAKDALVVA